MDVYKVLIIEDDSTLCTELRVLLTNNGYDACQISDFSNSIGEVKKSNPHLILLDINLPVEDGFQICTKIRTFSTVPIIFVTSKKTDMDELHSIMLGGDAFITKPYNTAILLARIASLLNRSNPASTRDILVHKDVKLHLENSTISFGGKKVEMTKNEFKIMCYLFKHTDKICSRSDIIGYLWDEQVYVEDNSLSVNITRIRDKLTTIGVVDFIKTKHRQGYMI